MKKYRFHGLGIEITRRCNKKCTHCARGEAQNLTMSTETIDKIFKNVSDVDRIVFGSGEALLEVERIEYFIRKLVDSHWNTTMIELTTNGTILDERIIYALEMFCLRKKGNFALLRISNDEFHSPEEYTKAYNYYKSLADLANERLHKYIQSDRILVKYTHPKVGKLGKIWYEGKAVELIDQDELQYSPDDIIYPFYFNHRIKICNDLVPCMFNILADGSVCFWGELSYDNSDRLTLGNIYADSLSTIIDRHNNSCMLLCSEADILYGVQYGSKMGMPESYLQLLGVIVNRIIELRKIAQKKYPNISAEDIICNLPFPGFGQLIEIMKQMYIQCPEYTPNMIQNITKYFTTSKYANYVNAMCLVVMNNLRKGNTDIYPHEYFCDDSDVVYLEGFEALAQLNTKAKQGKYKSTNKKVFPCDMLQPCDICYDAEAPTSTRLDFDSLYKQIITDSYEELFETSA